MSVARRLARLSQQYPFHSPHRYAVTPPTLHCRCLAYQAIASRSTERKTAHDITHPSTHSNQPNGDANSASSSPPPLFAPLLSSILTFIQRRAQPAEQSSSSTSSRPASSQPTTQHKSPYASLFSSASPALDLDDPSISLLFPRLPLPPPPPLHPQPPFPVPPVTRTDTRGSPTAHAAYSQWFKSQPLRTQLHVLLMQAATADARFVYHLERLVARRGEPNWEDEMASVSRRRMSDVRKRLKREDMVLEAMWKKERSEVEWRQIEQGRERLLVEHRGRHWQERWILFENKLKSDSGTAEERKGWMYERNRAEAEIRAHVRLLGFTNEATMELKAADLMRDTREGILKEWRWQDKAGVKRREKDLNEWKVRIVRSLVVEQAEWHETFARQKAVALQMAARQRKRRVSVATELRPIDWSHPPQSYDELLASFCYQHSERYKLELWRQHWYVNEMEQRAYEQQHLEAEDSQFRQRARFRAKLRTESKMLAAVQAEQAALEQGKRQSLRTLVHSWLSPIRSPLNGWHVYLLLRQVVGEGQLVVGLTTAAPGRTSEEVFNSAPVAGAVPPAPLPPSIAVTPFSWPYMLSYVSETARASAPVVRVREEEDGSAGGGATNVVIEVRNARRDAMVWMYEAMRDARAAAGNPDGASWGQVVRVSREGESEADIHGVESVGGGAVDSGGEHGWCVVDMGDVVLQTHSEDDTSGVTARRWLSEDQAKKRLSAIFVSRVNIITAAG